MQRIFLSMIVVFSWLSLAAAKEPELIVEIDRQKIYEGESVGYHITLNNVENPKEPSMKALDADFNVVSLPQNSMDSRSVTIINGHMTEDIRRGMRYNYRLTPKRTGVLTIPAPTVETDGRQLRGREVVLTVASPEEQDVVQMEIRCDRESVYPMQPFTVTLLISVRALPIPFSDRNPVGVQTEPPTLQLPWAIDEQLPKGLQPKVEWRQWLVPMKNNRGQGFNINNILDQERVFAMFGERQAAFLPSDRKVRLPDKSGKETDYWQFEFSRTFVAKRIGDFTFGPASLKGAFASELNAEGRPIGENIYTVAKPLTIQVKDVPSEGRPDSYTGAVGTFQLSCKLEPTKLKTGDPMTLTISITGEGTLDSAASPDLEKIPAIAEHFKIYKPTELTKGNQRQFTYSLRPLDADVREFPAVPLSYFDVDKGSYVTLRTEPIPIEVTKAVRLAERDIVASAPGFSGNAKEIETRREGIFANMTDAAELGDESVHPERWLSGLAGLASGYALLAVGVSRWRRISGDAALLRRRAAAGLAKRRLRESAAEFAAGRAREGADHVQTALLGLVADMLDLPAAGLTPAEACQRLESLGVESNLLGRLRTLLETCEGVRYGASAGGSESLNRDAQEMLRILTSALKRQKAPQLVSSLCLLGILSSLLLLSGCNRAVDLDLAKKFQAAQQAFEEAQKTEDFAKVAALDQEILDRGGVSGAVLYNQGNAWMRAGQPGRAVAAYRQAQRYLPRNRYLEENLRSALGRDAPATRRPVIETILFWQNWLSYPEKFSLAAAAAMATFVVAAAGLFAARRVLRRIVWAGLLLTVVLAFSAGYDWHRFDGVRHGVVTQPETIARKGNAASYAPAFNGTLREATEFELVEARGDWLLIRLPGDGEGWIEEKAAVTY